MDQKRPEIVIDKNGRPMVFGKRRNIRESRKTWKSSIYWEWESSRLRGKAVVVANDNRGGKTKPKAALSISQTAYITTFMNDSFKSTCAEYGIELKIKYDPRFLPSEF